MANPKVDVVSIAMPNGSHRPVAEAALRAGTHVRREKRVPVTLDNAQAMTALAAAHPGPVTILVDNDLGSPAHLAATRMVRDGVIGTPYAFRGV